MRVRAVFDDDYREDEPVYVISRAAELAGMHPKHCANTTGSGSCHRGAPAVGGAATPSAISNGW